MSRLKIKKNYKNILSENRLPNTWSKMDVTKMRKRQMDNYS